MIGDWQDSGEQGREGLARKTLKRDKAVLEKLARAEFGSADTPYINQLKTDMMNYARTDRSNESKVTRSYEGVRRFFSDPMGVPMSSDNYEFIKGYTKTLHAGLDEKELSSKEHGIRSKIFKDIIRRCNSAIKPEIKAPKERPITFNSRKSIIYLDQNQFNHSNIDDFRSGCIGFYETFRQPSMEEGRIVTREVMELFVNGGVITVNWYYRFNSETILPFTGHFVLGGDNAYFFLHNPKFKGRMRVLLTIDEFWKQERMLSSGGILLTQMPFVEDRNRLGFVARKVFVRRMPDRSLSTKQIDGLVKRVAKPDVGDEQFWTELNEFLFEDGVAGISV